jgi:hypothetical protein
VKKESLLKKNGKAKEAEGLYVASAEKKNGGYEPALRIK